MIDRGFTLFELLVAMAIFAVMSVMAYSGLRSMIETRELIVDEADQLAELQLAFTFLERDIQQAVQRCVLSEDNELLPAMVWDDIPGPHLEFTRGGWSNPAGRPRSSMVRVQYVLAEGALMRLKWPSLDRAPGSEPSSRRMLGGVDSFAAEFLDDLGQWHEKWPTPEDLAAGPTRKVLEKLPVAVRISMDVKGWGRINRLFLIAGNG